MPEPEVDRYLRQVVLTGFGTAGQARLGAARVVVVGAGGLGCALLPVLVAAGVGTVLVVDDDRVETSNLHRQTLYGPADVGAPKAAAAAARLTALGGGAVRGLDARLDVTTARALAADTDLLVDASDDLDARYALDDAAAAAGIPMVWGSAAGFAGQVGVADAAHGPRWRDLFPVPPAADAVPVCAVTGVLPSLCTTVGGLMATEVLKLVTGLGRPLTGRMLVVDALDASIREIPYGLADGPVRADQVERKESPVAQIEELTPTEVADLIEDGADVQILDVREPWEAELASLPGATLIPLGELGDRTGELDPGREVIAFCHGGVRSLRAAGILQRAGLRARSMAGGIDGWSRTVDAGVPRY